MSAGLGIGFAYESGRIGGPRLSAFISKPVLNGAMSCWTCEIRLEADTVSVRNVHGASSLQALELAAGIMPSLIQSLFPGEAFTESGAPVVLPSQAWPST
jgi:hypothetical protein